MNAVAAKPLTSWRPHWAKRFGTAPYLPMSRAEMQALGWDQCDIILVTGDARLADQTSPIARRYSHSMVPGGLLVTSRTTRLTSLTSLVIRVEILASTS